ncbi:unnamed protein product [Spodoptera exigua]|nr:unnamed protein product [Spodoptera exigua]
MDSLIVMRKPLRKPQIAPKCVISKSKKSAAKVEVLSSEPLPQTEESTAPPAAPVCFVQLYGRCGPWHRAPIPHSGHGDTLALHGDTPVLHGYCSSPSIGSARAHLVHELAYDRPYNLQ